mmetsp:Transcript_9582/g.15688  ORF Transcript_9582/g.15688 Transcript_9582/m.15688 type:complete len:210 (+) Transcript_9582:2418-3047(+)
MCCVNTVGPKLAGTSKYLVVKKIDLMFPRTNMAKNKYNDTVVNGTHTSSSQRLRVLKSSVTIHPTNVGRIHQAVGGSPNHVPGTTRTYSSFPSSKLSIPRLKRRSNVLTLPRSGHQPSWYVRETAAIFASLPPTETPDHAVLASPDQLPQAPKPVSRAIYPKTNSYPEQNHQIRSQSTFCLANRAPDTTAVGRWSDGLGLSFMDGLARY